MRPIWLIRSPRSVGCPSNSFQRQPASGHEPATGFHIFQTERDVPTTVFVVVSPGRYRSSKNRHQASTNFESTHRGLM